ncbi:hypothetical protein ESCO_002870 [Escovopsis weberi]|uniref:Extracellular protein n=1 Tax=Escovopsis weberi TaxID=150374 RepID=A0A0M9VSU7_ESCWE|nr:hypothetical protein ESCO_002870 [Escovopsis weberi]
MKSFTLGSVFGLAAIVQAHMEMSWPPPFRSKFNPNVPETSIDYSMTSPLSASGSDYPCKGYQVDFDTVQGKSVVEWQAGQTYNWTVAGSASHGGGSCQVSLSYDHGASFTVIHSYEGNCPLQPTWNFELPADVPTGDAIFSWSWHNNMGNREMYQNCAHVTISGGSSTGSGSGSGAASGTTGNAVIPPAAASPASSSAAAPAYTAPAAPAAPAASSAPAAPAAPSNNSGSTIIGGAGCYMPPAAASSSAAAAPVAKAADDYSTPPNITGLVTRSVAAAFSSRPAIFLANIGKGCTTAENTDVKYPAPGPAADTDVNSAKLAGPICNGAASRRAVRFTA